MDEAANEERGPPDSPQAFESKAKRRKVRKGTHSCWECKRRKVRCSLSTSSDSVCAGCRRRGTHCVSQEFPEEPTSAQSRHMGDRIVRVETLIENLAKQVSKGSSGFTASGPSSSIPSENGESSVAKPPLPEACFSPAVLTPESSSQLSVIITTPPGGGSRYEKVSAALYAALPPRGDINLMIKTGMDVSFDQLMTHPQTVLTQQPGGWKANLADVPHTNSHPVLLARYLLILATCLQYVNPQIHAEDICHLSEPPRQLMRRLFDAATNLVTKNDEFLGSIEGLECVMLEASYQGNLGNLRRAWLACRRGMVVAQMMGLHRGNSTASQTLMKVLDPTRPVFPSYYWFRIVWFDRQVSLMLGLPQGSLDESIASEAGLASDPNTPSDKFERKQGIIMSRILERNEAADSAAKDDLEALLELDAELQKAANEMPSKYWLTPNLANIVQNPEMAFWETLHLIEQMLYYNLLNLLHLPYLLRSSSKPLTERKYEYSRLTCANASREMLTRFIIFRSYHRVPFRSRFVDFPALTAAMTLVIAHLDGHRRQRKQQSVNVLAHQRNSDRAMMDQVLEVMDGVATLTTEGDALSERSSSLLRSLLTLEADVAEGRHGSEVDATVIRSPQPESTTDDGQSLRIGIPYFGTIKISRDGVISMEASGRATPPTPTGEDPTFKDGLVTNHDANSLDTAMLPTVQPRSESVLPEIALAQQPPKVAIAQASSAEQRSGLQAHQPFAPQFSSAISDTLQQEYQYPGLTAEAEDWAFQGVDMTFFNNIFRIPGIEGAGDSGSWEAWDSLQ